MKSVDQTVVIEGDRQVLAAASGLGLGLPICHRAAKANGGLLRVRDIPGQGCVFTLDLPRQPVPPLVSIDGEKRGTGASAAGQDESNGSGRS